VTLTADCLEHGRAGATADAIDNIPTVVVGAAGPSVAEGDARCPICLEVRDACGALASGSVEGSETAAFVGVAVPCAHESILRSCCICLQARIGAVIQGCSVVR
jgi:hypothetical protein